MSEPSDDVQHVHCGLKGRSGLSAPGAGNLTQLARKSTACKQIPLRVQPLCHSSEYKRTKRSLKQTFVPAHNSLYKLQAEAIESAELCHSSEYNETMFQPTIHDKVCPNLMGPCCYPPRSSRSQNYLADEGLHTSFSALVKELEVEIPVRYAGV